MLPHAKHHMQSHDEETGIITTQTTRALSGTTAAHPIVTIATANTCDVTTAMVNAYAGTTATVTALDVIISPIIRRHLSASLAVTYPHPHALDTISASTLHRLDPRIHRHLSACLAVNAPHPHALHTISAITLRRPDPRAGPIRKDIICPHLLVAPVRIHISVPLPCKVGPLDDRIHTADTRHIPRSIQTRAQASIPGAQEALWTSKEGWTNDQHT